jgi:hypothetical protein
MKYSFCEKKNFERLIERMKNFEHLIEKVKNFQHNRLIRNRDFRIDEFACDSRIDFVEYLHCVSRIDLCLVDFFMIQSFDEHLNKNRCEHLNNYLDEFVISI